MCVYYSNFGQQPKDYSDTTGIQDNICRTIMKGLLKAIVLNQKTATILGPELLVLDFRTSETKEILILRTNHQLYFVLTIRISFVSHIIKC